MKKINRSQSSYRCKTLVNEDEESVVAKYPNRHNHARNEINSVNSFVDANKENNSLYQSVSERTFPIKTKGDISEFDPGQDVLRRLEQKCKRQEEELKKLYEEREEYLRGNGSKGFHYTEQYYNSEIEALKEVIRHKDRELSYYKEEYSCKNEQIDSLNSEIYSKLQKDQRDKNLYVKEINSKMIEINHMQERVKIHMAEIQTLKLYITEKDSTIKELQDKVAQIDMKKKKIEHYESQIRDSNELLKELETRVQQLKEDTDQKDYLVAEKSKTVAYLEQTIGSYEDKLRVIENSLIRISEERRVMMQKNQELMQECQEWKMSYDELLKKMEYMQECEIKVKNYLAMVVSNWNSIQTFSK